MKNIILILIIVFAFSFTVKAEIRAPYFNVCTPEVTVLSGQVTDAFSNPIAGAQVSLTDAANNVCATDNTSSFGYYTLTPVYTSNYILRVTKSRCQGYAGLENMYESHVKNVALSCE